jgi:hypothetical protein
MAHMCFARKKASGTIRISVALIVKMRFFSWSDCDAMGRDFLWGSLAARIPELHRPELEIYRFNVIYYTISTPSPFLLQILFSVTLFHFTVSLFLFSTLHFSRLKGTVGLALISKVIYFVFFVFLILLSLCQDIESSLNAG